MFAIFFASRDASGAWTTPETLSDSLGNPAEVVFNNHIAFAESGDLYLVWQERILEDKAVYVMHQAPDGTWVTPLRQPYRLSLPSVEAFDPWLAAGREGVIVTWSERDDADDPHRVVARRSSTKLTGDEAARWGSVTRLSAPDVQSGGSRVAIGGDQDRAAAVWIEDNRAVLATIE